MRTNAVTVDAILPAGGCLTIANGETVLKAGIEIQGRSLLTIATEAIRESNAVRRIALIGPSTVTKNQDADLILEPGQTGPENLYKGLEALLAQPEPPSHVLIATTDLPFLTKEGVTGFLAQTDPKIDLNLPIVKAEAFQAAYPGAKATYAKIAEGRYTLGSLFLLNAQAMLKARPHIDAVFQARKSKLALAKLFGPVVLLKFVTGKLKLQEIEATAALILGCSAKAIQNVPVELAYDIDDAQELAYAINTQ
jgi:hypothetical protein